MHYTIHCTTLCYTVTILHYTLNYTKLHYATLYTILYTVLHYTILHSTTLYTIVKYLKIVSDAKIYFFLNWVSDAKSIYYRRANRVSAGPVVSNSEPLSPHRTPGLVCGGAAQ